MAYLLNGRNQGTFPCITDNFSFLSSAGPLAPERNGECWEKMPEPGLLTPLLFT